ncbi:MAG TPA: YaaL family protein [Clostridiaceae bacterium]|nr:YaaL family protein [Clostridiaceae bacterium]
MYPNPQKNYELKTKRNRFIHEMLKLIPIRGYANTSIEQQENEIKELLDSIRSARDEWMRANNNFEYADEQGLIDYYIYVIKACETKYEHYLKKAKEKGLKVDTIENGIAAANGN